MFHEVLRVRVAALAVAASLLVPASVWADAHEGGVTADTVMATVGEVEITLGHVIAAAATLSQEQLQQTPPDQILPGLLQRLIQQEAVAQAAEEVPLLTEFQLANERRSLIAAQVVQNIAGTVTVTDEDLQAAYDAQYGDFEPQQEFNASHILVETEEEALAIIEELNGGADFAAMAREYSTGPSGPGGGNLNWFGLGRMVPPFEAAVVELEVGEISGPVQTNFGWHVIRLNDSRIPNVPTLEEVRGTLENDLRREKFNAAILGIIDAAVVEEMPIEGFDPMVLFDGSILGGDE